MLQRVGRVKAAKFAGKRAGSVFREEDRLIVHGAVQDMHDFDVVVDDPVENEIPTVNPAPDPGLAMVRKKRIAVRHVFQFMAPVVDLLDEALGSLPAVLENGRADMKQVQPRCFRDHDLLG
jgi:hypothetical protein